MLTYTGIDVQAEIRAKTGSPSLGPVHMAPSMVPPPTAHRAIMNRHHQARRSASQIAPKLESTPSQGNPSPQLSRPTPISQQSSPSANSPGFQQGAMALPVTEGHMQIPGGHHQHRSSIPLGLANLPGGMMQQQQAVPVMKSPGIGGPPLQSPPAALPYYPTPYQGKQVLSHPFHSLTSKQGKHMVLLALLGTVKVLSTRLAPMYIACLRGRPCILSQLHDNISNSILVQTKYRSNNLSHSRSLDLSTTL